MNVEVEQEAAQAAEGIKDPRKRAARVKRELAGTYVVLAPFGSGRNGSTREG